MSSGPHHQVPMTQAQIAQQQQQQAMQVEMAKRRSRKPTDKNLPDTIDPCIIGDMSFKYRELRDFERRLDATMTRKRLDIVDSVNRGVKVGLFPYGLLVPQGHALTKFFLAMEDPAHMDHQYRRGPSLAVQWIERRHIRLQLQSRTDISRQDRGPFVGG